MEKDVLYKALELDQELSKVCAFLNTTKYKVSLVQKAKRYFLKSRFVSSEYTIELLGDSKKQVLQIIEERKAEIEKQIHDL